MGCKNDVSIKEDTGANILPLGLIPQWPHR